MTIMTATDASPQGVFGSLVSAGGAFVRDVLVGSKSSTGPDMMEAPLCNLLTNRYINSRRACRAVGICSP